MLVSEMLSVDSIEYLSPIAGSDNETQMLRIFLPSIVTRPTIRRRIDYASLHKYFVQINWQNAFRNCRNTNEYANCFMHLLKMAIHSCVLYEPIFRRRRLTRHFVLLLRKKKRTWTDAKRIGDYAKFKIKS